ncbi:MurR/RpiR family transcriptional regulator [Halomonas organivorans]|uniref:DNA-binding MurR/RpiR family transcriptional regulator n=1 Tax=Halomonas organivorans TaxID=257772 RepID=A0A7W5BU40_9GAMM|nr:MurR/RpiR family transcriptional regulator [Halomonas organivorans]MBB3139181.1 DNA-binding MurR/RpiR family transcriptional regulator [Halomonas organivorans]
MSGSHPQTKERPRSLEARIQEHLPELPSSERKLAELILDFPGELSAYNATELAKLAGVSKAAASRLFKRLGFRNFEQARRLVRDIKQWGSPIYLHERQQDSSPLPSEKQAFLDDHVTALTRTFDQLSAADIEAALQRIVDARRIWLVGYRNSYFMAAYARWQFIQFRPRVDLLPHPGETLGEHVTEFAPDDLLIAVGMRRRVPELDRVMQAAQERDMPVLYITDSLAGDKPFATWTLRCDISSSFLFHSYVGPMGLIHYLSVQAVRLTGKAGRLRLEDIEIAHEKMRDFDD